MMPEGIAGTRNSSARVSEGVNDSVTPPVGVVSSFLSDGVSPTVAVGVPLANDVDEVVTVCRVYWLLSPGRELHLRGLANSR